MALLRSQAPAEEMMKIVENFLEEVTKVSLILLKVTGSPLVRKEFLSWSRHSYLRKKIHQLLGVGHMLYNASRHDHGRHSSEAKRLM